jgi:hypothetical protein
MVGARPAAPNGLLESRRRRGGLRQYLLQLDREEIRGVSPRVPGTELPDEDDSTKGRPRIVPARDVFQRLAKVIDKVEREEEKKARIPRRVARLAKSGSESDPPINDTFLQAAAREFGGSTP